MSRRRPSPNAGLFHLIRGVSAPVERLPLESTPLVAVDLDCGSCARRRGRIQCMTRPSAIGDIEVRLTEFPDGVLRHDDGVTLGPCRCMAPPIFVPAAGFVHLLQALVDAGKATHRLSLDRLGAPPL